MHALTYGGHADFRGRNIIDDILMQGQRLRNSLVETILNNDPFYTTGAVTTNPTPRSLSEQAEKDNERVSNSESSADREGSTTSNDDRLPLSKLQQMSASEVRKKTDKIFLAYNQPCSCDTCKQYNNSCIWDSNLPTVREETPKENDVVKMIQENYRCTNVQYFRYIDSLQVVVHCLTLTDAGNRTVLSSDVDNRFKLPVSIRHTYFVEYHVPDVLTNVTNKVYGARDPNFVRVCSKKLQKEAVYFKQTSIHDVHLNENVLDGTQIQFKVSCRSLKQKKSTLLGVAKFSVDSFKVSKFLTCNQDLVVKSNDDSPVVLGVLKVGLKLGCGRMYFGKEFIDAASVKMENAIQPVFSETSSLSTGRIVHNNTEVALEICRKPQSNRISDSNATKSKLTTPRSPAIRTRGSQLPSTERTADKYTQSETDWPEFLTCRSSVKCITESDKRILFGFLYVSDAEYFADIRDSSLSCQPFCLNETIASRTVLNDSKPTFNFYQLVPLVYDDELLFHLRDNFIVLEFFKIESGNKSAFGLAKLPLHQFYLAYRSPVIVKYLLQNKLPVIGCDWWEPIVDIQSSDTIGQVQVLLALGSEEQIKQLEIERGFKENIVVAKKKQISSSSKKCVKNPPSVPKKVEHTFKTAPKTVDVGVQSSSNMETLVTCVENGTNTETTDHYAEPPVQLHKTADLLDTLTKALNIEPQQQLESTFKAKVTVEKATHLLGKKVRLNHDDGDGKVQTYVTFEADGGLKMTRLSLTSVKPKWDFQAEACLPTELLSDNQKRLIFKVWKKAKGSSEACVQTDEVIGFAALDLTVLLAGLPTISGWFNVVDFSNKCKGQIKIQVAPLEDITKYKKKRKKIVPSYENQTFSLDDVTKPNESGELLSRALKRKFVELDEITQRLRLRLSNVTKDESDLTNDDLADQFEKDINTLCVEDDFDMINLEIENENFNQHPPMHEIGLLQLDSGEKNSDGGAFNAPSAGINPLDRRVIQGKQRIDTLLEKLSLESNTLFSSGYATNPEAGGSETDILKDLGIDLRPSCLNTEMLLDSAMFRQMCVESLGPACTESSSGSDSSLLTSVSGCRRAPDGEGTNVNERSDKKGD